MAPPGTGDRSHAVQVSVDMDSPSFVPGSRLSAVITVRCEIASPIATDPRTVRPRFTAPNRSPLPTVVPNKSSPGTGAALRGLGADEYALVDYVVCEVSGRWTTDRAWVVPDAHAPASSTTLDLHSNPPLAAQVTSSATAPPVDLNSVSRPWNAALDDANKVGGGGRLGHSGVIFRSPTLVACEREQVPVGSQTSFAVQCVLPDEIPPTLRGAAVRYSYALIVVMGLPGLSAPKSVRVPFRVVCARSGTSPSDEPVPVRVPTPISSGPICNLFLERVRSRPLMMAARLLKSAPPDDIEVALALSLNGRLTPYDANGEPWRASHALDEDSLSFVREATDMPSVGDDMESSSPSSLRRPFSKRNAVPVYSITRGKDSIARMYLPKRRLLLGDNISAVFYFQADKPCLQLGARLEMQEIVKAKYSLGTKQDVTSAKGTVFRKVYGEHGEFVSMNRNTHVTFSIPYDAPASFSTDVVEIRWLLHFVFLIPQDKRSRPPQHAPSAGSTVLDDHEATRLLDQVEIEAESGSDEEELPGWSGGTWVGENPATFKAIPRGEVDVLRWTLPLQVMGEAYSQWGNRSHGRIRLETRGK